MVGVRLSRCQRLIRVIGFLRRACHRVHSLRAILRLTRRFSRLGIRWHILRHDRHRHMGSIRGRR